MATDTDIIAVPGLGQLPGVFGMTAAVAAFALTLSGVLRRRPPSYSGALGVGLVTAMTHLAAVAVAVLLSSGDLVTPVAVADHLVRGGASAVLFLAAGIAAWAGVALRRTRARHPRWPWEGEEGE